MTLKSIFIALVLLTTTASHALSIDKEKLTASFSLFDPDWTKECPKDLRKANPDQVESCYRLDELSLLKKGEFKDMINARWFILKGETLLEYQGTDVRNEYIVNSVTLTEVRAQVERKFEEYKVLTADKRNQEQIEKQKRLTEAKERELQDLKKNGRIKTTGYESVCMFNRPTNYFGCDVKSDFEIYVNLTILNDSEKRIKDINILCLGLSKTESVLTNQQLTVYEFIEPNSTIQVKVKLPKTENVANYKCSRI